MSLAPSYEERLAEENRKGGTWINESSGTSSRWVRGQNVPYRSKEAKKKGRAFHKLLSGIKIGRMKGEKISHLVLTSAPGTEYSKLNRDFQRLAKRLERKFGKIPYCKVKTKEGFGVLHVLLRTKLFVPQTWLSENWNETHKGSQVVWINRIYGPSKEAAGYLAGQYCSAQAGFDRLSLSQDWIKKGSSREWRETLVKAKYSLVEAVADWDRQLACIARVQIAAAWQAPVVRERRRGSVRGRGWRCKIR